MSMLTRDQIYTTMNHPKTHCLFRELCKHDDEPIFTVRSEKEGYISLRNLFVKYTLDDPSETTFAEEVFGDYGYWLVLQEARKLKPFVEEWRQIADAKRKSVAFKSIFNEVKSQGKGSLTASKFLIDEPWKDKRNPKVKANSKKSTQEAVSHFKDDLERLRDEGMIN